MSIRDFHSKLSSRNHNTALFQALRELRRLDVGILFQEDSTLAGWNPWMDGHEHHRHATAGA